MATFNTMDKVRPGVYTKYRAIHRDNFTPGTRGIVTLPLHHGWGPVGSFFEITAQEFQNGTAQRQYGLDPTSDNTIQLREALKGASVALVWRIGASTAVTATADLFTDVTASAIYAGTVGNEITVSITERPGGGYYVITTVSGVEYDRQVCNVVGDFVPNGWININGASETPLEGVAGVQLAGGTDGAMPTIDDYTAYTKAAEAEVWNVMAIPETDETIMTVLRPTLKDYVENMRDNLGQKVQVVGWKLNGQDSMGLISVEQMYYIGTEAVSQEATICYIAGISAGATITTSNTFHLIPYATSYEPLLSIEDEDAALTQGRMLLSMRKDRSIVVLKDINTLTTFDDEEHSYVFSKNRVVRTLDEIETQITIMYENSFIGKVNNDENGRGLFRAAISSYMANLVAQGAIINFNASTDLIVAAGPDIESVIVELSVQTVDSMEKLYMTISVS